MAADTRQRRVYLLAPDLLERVTAFQAKAGCSSEVEAVRILLDAGLSQREDGLALQTRAERALASGEDPRRMLFGHPALKRMTGLAGAIIAGPVEVECKDGHRFTLQTGDGR